MPNEEYSREIDEIPIMGDIKEDIKLAGFSMPDVFWIAGVTGISLIFILMLPIALATKLMVPALIFLGMVFFRALQVPYRMKRFYFDVYGHDEGIGEELPEFLGLTEDGLFYQSGPDIHMILNVKALPWDHEEYRKKISRIMSFQDFLRACVMEGIKPQIIAEQVGDFQHAIWNRQEQRSYASSGIKELSLARVERQRTLAENKKAQRSEYTFRLTIPRYKVAIRERDNERQGLDKKELRRDRLVAELLEKKARVFQALQHQGHEVEILGGFAITELLSRHWAHLDWEKWKSGEWGWQEPEPIADEEVQIDYQQISYTPFSEREDEDVPIDEHHKDEEQQEYNSPEELIDTIMDSVQEQEAKPSLMYRLLHVWIPWILQFCRQGLHYIKEEAMRMQQFVKRNIRRPKKAKVYTMPVPIEVEDEDEYIPDAVAPAQQLSGVLWLTSPSSSGQTFLAANVAAAYANVKKKVTLIDLSVDHGTLTVLNPVKGVSEQPSFDYWTSNHIEGLSVYLPIVDPFSEKYPLVDHVIELIEHQKIEGLVLIDLPWTYPDRAQIMNRYPGIGIIDSNYHHWLQWEKEVSTWQHDFWINQADEEMSGHMSRLVEVQYNRPVTAIFPLFQAANKYLYLGRPLGIQHQYQSHFVVDEVVDLEEEVSLYEAQTTA